MLYFTLTNWRLIFYIWCKKTWLRQGLRGVNIDKFLKFKGQKYQNSKVVGVKLSKSGYGQIWKICEFQGLFSSFWKFKGPDCNIWKVYGLVHNFLKLHGLDCNFRNFKVSNCSFAQYFKQGIRVYHFFPQTWLFNVEN